MVGLSREKKEEYFDLYYERHTKAMEGMSREERKAYLLNQIEEKKQYIKSYRQDVENKVLLSLSVAELAEV